MTAGRKPDPWERQPAESPQAFAAFSAYRDMPPTTRSISKAIKAEYGANPGRSRHNRWKDWSAQHKWVERAAAWDARVDQVSRETDLEVVREMRKRHAQFAREVQEVGYEALKRLARKVKAGKKELSPGLVLQFITQPASMERSALGEPTEITKSVDDGPVSVKVVWDGPPIDNGANASAAHGAADSEGEPGTLQGAGLRQALGQNAPGQLPEPGDGT